MNPLPDRPLSTPPLSVPPLPSAGEPVPSSADYAGRSRLARPVAAQSRLLQTMEPGPVARLKPKRRAKKAKARPGVTDAIGYFTGELAADSPQVQAVQDERRFSSAFQKKIAQWYRDSGYPDPDPRFPDRPPLVCQCQWLDRRAPGFDDSLAHAMGLLFRALTKKDLGVLFCVLRGLKLAQQAGRIDKNCLDQTLNGKLLHSPIFHEAAPGWRQLILTADIFNIDQRCLLRQGVPSVMGFPPVMTALKHSGGSLADLLAAGADPGLRTVEGLTLLAICTGSSVADRLDKLEVILDCPGVDINQMTALCPEELPSLENFLAYDDKEGGDPVPDLVYNLEPAPQGVAYSGTVLALVAMLFLRHEEDYLLEMVRRLLVAGGRLIVSSQVPEAGSQLATARDCSHDLAMFQRLVFGDEPLSESATRQLEAVLSQGRPQPPAVVTGAGKKMSED